MGPPIAESALQQSQLICDADELHLYSDRMFAGADTLVTAEVLKAGIKKMANGQDMDIVFAGHRASDGETGQITFFAYSIFSIFTCPLLINSK